MMKRALRAMALTVTVAVASVVLQTSSPLYAATGTSVNFQPAGAPLPSGYKVDSGQAFDDARGYGWVTGYLSRPTSLVGQAFDRNRTSDQRSDTLINMQERWTLSRDGWSSVTVQARWEHAVANGTYDVTVAVGDSANVDGRHDIRVEGFSAIAGFVPTTSSRHRRATVRVEVRDGRLTIAAAGGTNTKLNYVEWALVMAPTTTAPVPTITLPPTTTTTTAPRSTVTAPVASRTVEGDTGSPGAEVVTDPRALWQGTASWTSDAMRSFVPGAGSSGSENLRVQSVAGSSWKAEMWSHNPGGGVGKGFEQRLYLGDLGLPTDLEEGAFRYMVKWPAGFKKLGDMKLPSLSGFDPKHGVETAMRRFAQAEETDDSWGAALMSGYPSNFGLKHYLGLPRVGTTSYRSPDHNYWNIVEGVQRPMQEDVWWEVIVYVKLNTTYGAPGGDNGVYSLYMTPAGQAQRTRVSHLTNVQYRTSPASDIKFINFRSFWGGGTSQMPTSPTSYADSPRFRDLVFATTVDAVPTSRAT